MWFWIVLIAFILIVFLVARGVGRGHGDIHNVGLPHGYGMGEAGDAGEAGGGWGDGGWGADG